MKTLLECREIINDIDPKMQALFITRMETVKDVALYKLIHDLPIFDEKREAEIIERLSKDIDQELKPYYIDFIKAVMNISKEYQKAIITKNKK